MTEVGKQWEMWTLSEGDMENVCKANEWDFKKLTESHKDEIARQFQKGVEARMGHDWTSILDGIIEEYFDVGN